MVKGKYMKDESWRKNFVFVTVAMPIRGLSLLARLDQKRMAEGFVSKAELYRTLVEGWTKGLYKGLKVNEKGSIVEGGDCTTLSMFYPKALEASIQKKLVADGIHTKVTLLRALVLAWLDDEISADPKRKMKTPFRFTLVSVTDEIKAKFNAKMKAGKLPASKPEIIIALAKRYVETDMKVDAHKLRPGGLSESFGVRIPAELDNDLEKKMKTEGVRYKATLLRCLLEQFLAGKIVLK